jgi:hypothetical protein
LRGASFIARPFYAEIITAGVGISHVDVRHTAILEQLLDLRLYDPIRNIALGNQSPAACIRIEGEAMGQHVDGKSRILRISFTVVLVDEDGTG